MTDVVNCMTDKCKCDTETTQPESDPSGVKSCVAVGLRVFPA
jgi:hypothetical protein